MASVFRTSFKPTTRTITWTLSSTIFDIPCSWKDLYTAPKFSFAGLDWEIGCEPTRRKGLEKAIFLSVRILSGSTLAKAAVRFEGNDDKDKKLFPIDSKRGKTSVYSQVSFEKPLVLYVPPEKRLLDDGAGLTMIFTIEVLAEEATTGRQQEDSWESAMSNLSRMEQKRYGFDLEIVPASGDPLMVYKMFWTFQSRVIMSRLAEQPSKSSLALPFSRKSLEAFAKYAYYRRLPDDLLLLLELSIFLKADELLSVLRTAMSKNNCPKEALRYLKEFKRLKVKPPEVLVSVALEGNRQHLVPIFSEVFDKDVQVCLEVSPLTQVTKLATPEKDNVKRASLSSCLEKTSTVENEITSVNSSKIKTTKSLSKVLKVISPIKVASLFEQEDSQDSDDYGLDRDLESIMNGEMILDSPPTKAPLDPVHSIMTDSISKIEEDENFSPDKTESLGSEKEDNYPMDPSNRSSSPDSKRPSDKTHDIPNLANASKRILDEDTNPTETKTCQVRGEDDSCDNKTSHPLSLSHSLNQVCVNTTKEMVGRLDEISAKPLSLSHCLTQVCVTTPKEISGQLDEKSEKSDSLPATLNECELKKSEGEQDGSTLQSSTANSRKTMPECLEVDGTKASVQEKAPNPDTGEAVLSTVTSTTEPLESSVGLNPKPIESKTCDLQKVIASSGSEFVSQEDTNGGKSFLLYKRSQVRSNILKPDIVKDAPIFIKKDESQQKLSNILMPNEVILPLTELTTATTNQLPRLKSSNFIPICGLNAKENWSIPLVEPSLMFQQMSHARTCPKVKQESNKSGIFLGASKGTKLEAQSCQKCYFGNVYYGGLHPNSEKRRLMSNPLSQIKKETSLEQWNNRLLRKIDQEGSGFQPGLQVFSNVADLPALPTLSGSSEIIEHPETWSTTSVGVPLNPLGVPINPYLNKQFIFSTEKVKTKGEPNFGIPTDVCKSKLEVHEGKEWLKPLKVKKRSSKSKPCLRKYKTRSTKMKWRSTGTLMKNEKAGGDAHEFLNSETKPSNQNASNSKPSTVSRKPLCASRLKRKSPDSEADCPPPLALKLPLPSSKRVSKGSETEKPRSRSGSGYSGYKSCAVATPRRYKKRYRSKIDPSCTKCTKPLEKLRHTCKRRRLLKTDILAAAVAASKALSTLSNPAPVVSTTSHAAVKLEARDNETINSIARRQSWPRPLPIAASEGSIKVTNRKKVVKLETIPEESVLVVPKISQKHDSPVTNGKKPKVKNKDSSRSRKRKSQPSGNTETDRGKMPKLR